MSFLAPFFILGALTVSLPILFHLIRRTPRGRTVFSSLMFLSPSPPRVTRRSRIDHWLLLLLRAAALCLIAVAFARPFLREAELLGRGSPGRRVAILLDTSASMRRGDLWQQALAKVDGVLDGLTPADQLAVYTFDRNLQRWLGFDDDPGVSTGARAQLVRSRLAEVGPTWGATELGSALVAVADAADSPGTASEPNRAGRALDIVLVTDLQRGSHVEALAAFDWPERARVTVERVTLPGGTNAGIDLLAGSASRDGAERLRVRVTNEAGSARDEFSLHWQDAADPGAGSHETDPGILASAGSDVPVPEGESRVVVLDRPEAAPGAERLVLTGDDHDFDNTLWSARPERDEVTVAYFGPEASDDAGGPRYYLERALAGDRRRDVRVIAPDPDAPLPPGSGPEPRLTVVTTDVTAPLARSLRQFAERGGTVLCVVTSESFRGSLAALLGIAEPGVENASLHKPSGDKPSGDDPSSEALGVEEAAVDDYAMLTDIDFTHSLFASFADPRFNDFTKIRFWHHRRLRFGGEKPTELAILARFDNGDPAIVEERVGQGRILVFASGWHPRDSQLALSSKFVPLVASVLALHPDATVVRESFVVGDPIPVPTAMRADPATPSTVMMPDGSERQLAATAATFDVTEQPGVYALRRGGVERRFAVNLAPTESRTGPLAIEELEQHGVRLGTHSRDLDRQRQLRDVELEGSQKLWRALVIAALAILLVETWLAGRVARATAGSLVVKEGS